MYGLTWIVRVVVPSKVVPSIEDAAQRREGTHAGLCGGPAVRVDGVEQPDVVPEGGDRVVCQHVVGEVELGPGGDGAARRRLDDAAMRRDGSNERGQAGKVESEDEECPPAP